MSYRSPPSGAYGSVIQELGAQLDDFKQARARLRQVPAFGKRSSQNKLQGEIIRTLFQQSPEFLNTFAGFACAGLAFALWRSPTVAETVATCASWLAVGAGYLVMAAAHGWQLAGPAYAVVGFAIGVGAVVSIAMRQRLTPPEVMGRVGAASRGIVWGAAPVGALLAGSLAALLGLRVPLVLAGVLQVLVAVILARPLLRALREDASPPLAPTR